jgi:hypothetical protein
MIGSGTETVVALVDLCEQDRWRSRGNFGSAVHLPFEEFKATWNHAVG